jgi:hypothetical protein
MGEFTYNSDLTGGSLMVRESRVVANLLLSNVSEEEWRQKIQVDNALQKRSAATAKRKSQAIRKRLELMEPEYWRAIRDGDDELATQTTFVTALQRNSLFVEFMERVVKDLYAIHVNKIELYHWLDFLDDYGNRDKKILDWQESTRKKTGQIVFRMLAEVGFLDSVKLKNLQTIVLRPEVKTMLENTCKQRLMACMDMGR